MRAEGVDISDDQIEALLPGKSTHEPPPVVSSGDKGVRRSKCLAAAAKLGEHPIAFGCSRTSSR